MVLGHRCAPIHSKKSGDRAVEAREFTKLKAERGILEKAAAYFAQNAKLGFIVSTGRMRGGLDVRGARCLAGWLLADVWGCHGSRLTHCTNTCPLIARWALIDPE